MAPLLAIGGTVAGFVLGFWIRGTYPVNLDDLYDVWGDDAEDVDYDDVEDAVQVAELAFYGNAPNAYYDDESEEAL